MDIKVVAAVEVKKTVVPSSEADSSSGRPITDDYCDVSFFLYETVLPGTALHGTTIESEPSVVLRLPDSVAHSLGRYLNSEDG